MLQPKQSNITPISHLWIIIKGKFYLIENNEHNSLCHVDEWGEQVWTNPNRGYYNQKNSVVFAHAKWTPKLLKQVEKELDKHNLECIYYIE